VAKVYIVLEDVNTYTNGEVGKAILGVYRRYAEAVDRKKAREEELREQGVSLGSDPMEDDDDDGDWEVDVVVEAWEVQA
jgi:hypothetical protein